MTQSMSATASPSDGRGSTANVLAAIASFFIPGLGQLFQGRMLLAAFLFVSDIFLWFFWLGWLMHIYACFNAAVYQRKSQS